MTNHFFAIDPQGKAHTRSSKGRTYTHTVVYRRGEAKAERDYARALKATPGGARETYTFEQDKAAGQVDRTWGFRVDDAARAKYVIEGSAFIAQHPTVEDYIEHRLALAHKRHAEMVAEGYYTRWDKAGWTSRLDLAVKLAASVESQYGQPGEVEILDAQVGKPPKA